MVVLCITILAWQGNRRCVQDLVLCIHETLLAVRRACLQEKVAKMSLMRQAIHIPVLF
jgi:hypothetical protein